MPQLYVKNRGRWVVPRNVFVKRGGIWQRIPNLYIRRGNTWVRIYPETGTQTFTANGTFTVPVGVSQLLINMTGGSGGGGGGGTGNGQNGGTSFRDIRTVDVNSGEIVSITVGLGGEGGRSGVPNCGSNAATWIGINNDGNQRRGRGRTGFANGGDGSGAGCPNSFNSTGGWSGGGGGSSAYVFSGGTVIAGGGAGGNGGVHYQGGSGTGGSGGSAGQGNQGAAGVLGGPGQAATFSGAIATDGTNGSVIVSW